MNTTALFTLSLLLLGGIYGLYWVEGRRRGHTPDPTLSEKPRPPGRPTG